MKGQIISKEFNSIAWVKDNNGTEYACKIGQRLDVKRKEDLSEHEQKSCMNLNAVLGDSW